MHRNVGLLSAAFLAVHVATTVVDEFVDVFGRHQRLASFHVHFGQRVAEVGEPLA